MITDEERAEYSAAGTLARRVRELCAGWVETSEGLGHWRFEDRDEDYGGRHVIIDGRARTLRVLPVGEGVHVGPSVIGWCSGVTVNVTLPECTDNHDRESALACLAAVAALDLPS